MAWHDGYQTVSSLQECAVRAYRPYHTQPSHCYAMKGVSTKPPIRPKNNLSLPAQVIIALPFSPFFLNFAQLSKRLVNPAALDKWIFVTTISYIFTWKKSRAPTARTTPMAKPRANMTRSNVQMVNVTFGSKPVP